MSMTFAEQVREAATEIAPVYGDKYWISDIMATFPLSPSEFRAKLWDAHIMGEITLTRCDLVEAFDSDKLTEASQDFDGFVAHFVCI